MNKLDQEVAKKVMGWKVRVKEINKGLKKEFYYYEGNNKKFERYKFVPSSKPSYTQIIIDRMIANGFDFEVTYESEDDSPWRAKFWNGEGKYGDVKTNSMQESICRSALEVSK